MTPHQPSVRVPSAGAPEVAPSRLRGWIPTLGPVVLACVSLGGGLISCGGSSNSASTVAPPPVTTVTISGQAGRAGVTLSYTDGTAKTVTASATGAYSFTVNSGWSGTVTPTLAGYAFTPASRTYSNVTANQATGQDYVANALTFTISGDAGASGVTLSYTDGTAKTVVSDGSGAFSFVVPYDWSGTLTPAKAGYSFTPASRTYTKVMSNQTTGQSFVASQIQLTLSGNAGTPGATLSYFDGVAKSVTADAGGNFSFTVPYGWSGTLTPFKAAYAPTLPACTFVPAALTFSNVTAPASSLAFATVPVLRFGVAVFSKGWIGILDPATQTMTTQLLGQQLIDQSNSTFDVALTPDGRTGVISRFADEQVAILDLRNPQAPQVSSVIDIGFFAEDVDITPDGRFALVSDGGFSSTIAVIDLENRVLREVFDYPTDPSRPMSCAVAVSPDGRTVLSVDYFSGKIHNLSLDATGHLTYVNTLSVPTQNGSPLLRPINVRFSPDGKTAIVVSNCSSYDAFSNLKYEDMAWPILSITGPNQVQLSGLTKPSFRVGASQSVVFHPSGTKAYVSCVRDVNDPAYPNQRIEVLNITAPGVAVSAGTPIDVNFVGTSQLFGVDTLAMEPSGRYLYLTNMTLSGAKAMIQVIDVTTGKVVKDLATPPVRLSGSYAGQDAEAVATGIVFTKH